MMKEQLGSFVTAGVAVLVARVLALLLFLVVARFRFFFLGIVLLALLVDVLPVLVVLVGIAFLDCFSLLGLLFLFFIILFILSLLLIVLFCFLLFLIIIFSLFVLFTLVVLVLFLIFLFCLAFFSFFLLSFLILISEFIDILIILPIFLAHISSESLSKLQRQGIALLIHKIILLLVPSDRPLLIQSLHSPAGPFLECLQKLIHLTFTLLLLLLLLLLSQTHLHLLLTLRVQTLRANAKRLRARLTGSHISPQDVLLLAKSATTGLGHLLVLVILQLPGDLISAALAQPPKRDLLVDLQGQRVELDLESSLILVFLALLALLLLAAAHQQSIKYNNGYGIHSSIMGGIIQSSKSSSSLSAVRNSQG